MASKTIRLSTGSIFPKGPGKIYFYRYQVDGHRKTVSLQTTVSTDSFEYKVFNFSCSEQRSFNIRIADMARNGWEYVGVLTTNVLGSREVLFRRTKRKSFESDTSLIGNQKTSDKDDSSENVKK